MFNIGDRVSYLDRPAVPYVVTEVKDTGLTLTRESLTGEPTYDVGAVPVEKLVERTADHDALFIEEMREMSARADRLAADLREGLALAEAKYAGVTA